MFPPARPGAAPRPGPALGHQARRGDGGPDRGARRGGLPLEHLPEGGGLAMTRRESRGRGSGRNPFGIVVAAVMLTAGAALTGCTTTSDAVPGCGDPLRLAVVAQSVPSASYVPCIRDLPPGWTTSGFDPTQDGTSFLLNSDRAPGRPVKVRFTATGNVRGASPSPSRAPGVLTY